MIDMLDFDVLPIVPSGTTRAQRNVFIFILEAPLEIVLLWVFGIVAGYLTIGIGFVLLPDFSSTWPDVCIWWPFAVLIPTLYVVLKSPFQLLKWVFFSVYFRK